MLYPDKLFYFEEEPDLRIPRKAPFFENFFSASFWSVLYTNLFAHTEVSYSALVNMTKSIFINSRFALNLNDFITRFQKKSMELIIENVYYALFKV